MTLIVTQYQRPGGAPLAHFHILVADDATGFREVDDTASSYPMALRRAALALESMAKKAEGAE